MSFALVSESDQQTLSNQMIDNKLSLVDLFDVPRMKLTWKRYPFSLLEMSLRKTMLGLLLMTNIGWAPNLLTRLGSQEHDTRSLHGSLSSASSAHATYRNSRFSITTCFFSPLSPWPMPLTYHGTQSALNFVNKN